MFALHFELQLSIMPMDLKSMLYMFLLLVCKTNFKVSFFCMYCSILVHLFVFDAIHIYHYYLQSLFSIFILITADTGFSPLDNICDS